MSTNSEATTDSTTDTAYAIRIDKFGTTNEFYRAEFEVPAPGTGEVTVKTAAIGANPIDYKMRDGSSGVAPTLTFPCTLGREAAGTVVAVGEGVTDFAIGDRVFGMRVHPDVRGTYASHNVFKAEQLVHTPEGLDDVHAAGISIAGLTAMTIVEKLAKPKEGDVVLVHGAGGGVGQLVTQLCIAHGATVLASASGRHAEKLARFGAKHIDYTAGDVFEQVHTEYPDGVDIVVDSVYFGTAEGDLDIVREGGKLIFIPTLADTEPAKQRGIDVAIPMISPDNAASRALAEKVASGEIEMPIGATYPLSEVAEVHHLLEDGHANGKIVMTV